MPVLDSSIVAWSYFLFTVCVGRDWCELLGGVEPPGTKTFLSEACEFFVLYALAFFLFEPFEEPEERRGFLFRILCFGCLFHGCGKSAPGWTRTSNLGIMSPLL